MRRIVILAAAVAFIGLGVFTLVSRRTFVIELTQSDIQAHLDKGFPLEKGVLIFSVKLSNPKVDLTGGSDRIGFRVDVGSTLHIDGITPKGTGTILTRIRYSSDSGEFFMSDPDLELELEGVKEEKVRTVNEAANILVKEFAEKYPIYRLKETDVRQSLARTFLKDVKVEDGVLKIYLGLG